MRRRITTTNTLNRSGAEMSFPEIGKRLGISRTRALQLYHSALRKLRRSNPQLLANLMALSRERQHLREGTCESKEVRSA